MGTTGFIILGILAFYLEALPQIKKPEMLTIALEPGFVSEYLSIKKPRIIVAEKVKDGVVRIPVEGAHQPYLYINLNRKSLIQAPPKVLKNPHNVVMKTVREVNVPFLLNSKISNLQVKMGTQVQVNKTVIRIDENGKGVLGANVLVPKSGHLPVFMSYDDVEPAPTIGAPHQYALLERFKVSNFEDQALSLLGGAFDVADEVIHRATPYSMSGQLHAWYKSWTEKRDNIYNFVAKNCLRQNIRLNPDTAEITIPSTKPDYIGWDAFSNEVATFLGHPINNCNPTKVVSDTTLDYGAVVLDYEYNLAIAFSEHLLGSRRLPERWADVSPEKIAAADVCTRTCIGEMGTADCYTQDKQFFPYHLKAVVGTIYLRSQGLHENDTASKVNYTNRSYLSASDKIDYPYFTSVGYIPHADKSDFSGAVFPNLLKNPLLEASILKRQYHNWRDPETLKKSLCPTLNPNGDPERGLFHNEAVRACAKYCAQAAFDPNFESKHLANEKVGCDFDRTSFTSHRGNRKVGLPGCRQITSPIYVCDDSGKGKVDVNIPSCTRFWEAQSPSSGCLDN